MIFCVVFIISKELIEVKSCAMFEKTKEVIKQNKGVLSLEDHERLSIYSCNSYNVEAQSACAPSCRFGAEAFYVCFPNE
jgi:hypothetical protein